MKNKIMNFKINNDLKKRSGVIRFNPVLIETMSIAEIKLFFSNFYIVNTDLVEFMDIQYYGYSEHFREVEEAEISPQYEVIINSLKLTIQFKEINR